MAAAPDTPENVNATVETSRFSISCSVPASDGGSLVTGYEYRFDTGNRVSTGSTVTSRTFTDIRLLAENRNTQFQLRAVNAVCPGAPATIELNRQVQVTTPMVSLSLETNSIDESGANNNAMLTVTLSGLATTADATFSVPTHDEYTSSPASRTIAADSGAHRDLHHHRDERQHPQGGPDGRFVTSTFDGKADELDAGDGHTLRLGAEASRRHALDGWATVTPRFEPGFEAVAATDPDRATSGEASQTLLERVQVYWIQRPNLAARPSGE